MASTRERPFLGVRSIETIIIGAGIAGEACARRLSEAQRSFHLISENLGGRISRSQDDSVNMGAYYVRGDYEHVNQLVERGRHINKLTTLWHDRDGSHTSWNRRLLSHLPQAARFLHQLRVFQRHYQALKDSCLAESQAQAIRSDPYLWRLYQQPATEFIEQHRLGATARHYLGPGLHATTFLRLDELTAFTLLLGALPLLVPIFEFTYRSGQDADWARSASMDIVTGITPDQYRYRVDTRRSGAFIADAVVLATPPDVSQRLLGLPEMKAPVTIHSFQLEGKLRDRWARADINLFAEDDPVCAVARQANGSILLCAHEEQPRFDDYLISWEVIEHRCWNPAFNLVGDTLLDCEQSPNLYVVGDHNICGLEDAYLTGLYAANQIVANRRSRQMTQPRFSFPAQPSPNTGVSAIS
jgi:hypothetical protein